MNGEHDDHERGDGSRKPFAQERTTAHADDASGPRASAHPVSNLAAAELGPGEGPGRRSGPPPKPRLKDSKYPPPPVSPSSPAAPAEPEAEPRPYRAKVISSPDLPPARPRTSPPPPGRTSAPDLSDDAEATPKPVIPRAPAAPTFAGSETPSRAPLAPPPIPPRPKRTSNPSVDGPPAPARSVNPSRPPVMPPAPIPRFVSEELDDDEASLTTPMVPPKSPQAPANHPLPPAPRAPARPAAGEPRVSPPPPAPMGAATSYPPPSTSQPPKLDPIAVHAIRVISFGVGDSADLPPPPRALDLSAPGSPAGGGEELEELEEYADEVEPAPDSLDDAELEALSDDTDDAAPELTIDVEEEPLAESRPAELKPPPPPKRKTPSPPKKKEPKVPAKKRRPWWEEIFSEDFARATHHLSSRHIKREVDFIDHSLGVAQGAVVLDLACGMGQHSIELAERGYSVVGFDLSVFQLAVAGEAAQERGLKINFLQGDMREMAFQEMFDGIFCWNTSFGYFEEEKNVAVAERIFQALRPGGMFLIDVVNRDHVMQHQPSQVWFQGDACVCMDDMSVDYITSRLRVKRSIIMDDGRTRECFYSIRLYTLHELGKLLHEVGFRVIEASGHPTTPGVYLGPNSPRVIILAQRP